MKRKYNTQKISATQLPPLNLENKSLRELLDLLDEDFLSSISESLEHGLTQKNKKH